MSIHVHNGYNLLPSHFQFTIGRIMDAVLANTGSAVTFERTKAKHHSKN